MADIRLPNFTSQVLTEEKEEYIFRFKKKSVHQRTLTNDKAFHGENLYKLE